MKTIESVYHFDIVELSLLIKALEDVDMSFFVGSEIKRDYLLSYFTNLAVKLDLD